jgi:K+-transporting ATPase KdpF subunit
MHAAKLGPLRFPYSKRPRNLRRLDVAVPIVKVNTDQNRKGNLDGLRHGRHLPRADARLLRRDRGIDPLLRELDGQERQVMNWVYWLGGLSALGIFVYLVVALFKPELFS